MIRSEKDAPAEGGLTLINYRGGLVRFRIPAPWREECGEAGGGTFYARADDSGTLRLNVDLYGPPAGRVLGVDDAREFLASFAKKYGVPVRVLRQGVAMIRYDMAGNEGGHELMIRYWHVAQVLPPGHVRQSLFSYTLLAGQFEEPHFQGEMELLEREVSAAESAAVLGC